MLNFFIKKLSKKKFIFNLKKYKPKGTPMKTLTVLLIMFISTWALAQTSGRLQKIADRELEQTLYHLSYNNVDESLFSLSEKKRLAGGDTVKKKIFQFMVPTTLIPTKMSEAYLDNTYAIDNDAVRIKGSKVILSDDTINDISVLSFLLPLLVIFFTPLVSCGATGSIKKLIVRNIFLAEVIVFLYFIFGIIFNNLANNPVVSGMIVLTLVLITVLSKKTKTEKTIVVSGIIAGSSLAIFSARLSILGLGLFSSGMSVMWGYLGIYILVGSTAAIIVASTRDEPEAIILAIEDDYD